MDEKILPSILKLLIEMQSEIKTIKVDITNINKNIEQIKIEHDRFHSAFPNGIDDHREVHRKKRFFFL